MTPPRWIVPLSPGQLTADSPQLIVAITEGLQVEAHELGREGQPLPHLSPIAACQLGQALLDASTYAGQRLARRRAR